MSDKKQVPSQVQKRTPEQIEADLHRTRELLASTVNELTDRLDPRAQVESVKSAATEKARLFADDVSRKDPKAIATLAAGVAGTVLLLVLRARRR